MAERFGGKYSPGADKARGIEPEAQVDPAGARSNLLFVPGAILAVTGFFGGPTVLALSLAGAASWTLAAWLTREGLRAEGAYNARSVARRPAMPRKMLGSVLIGGGTFLGALAHGTDIIGSALYALIAAVLHSAAFGIDPLVNKTADGADTFQSDRVARVVDEGEAHLKRMTDAIVRTGDRKLIARVERFQATARALFRIVEEDPRDLTAARKYLGVYLMGARDATVKFATLYTRRRDAQARADYEALLDDLEKDFAARSETLLLDDRSDLTVEIEVLRERLAREGVRPE